MNIEIPTTKSLYIEMYFGETKLSSGTATLISKNRSSHLTLITNRHNVTGRHQETGECLSKYAAVPDAIVIYFHKNVENEDVGKNWLEVRLPLYRDDSSPYWIEHPRLRDKADIVALNLNWANDVHKYPYYLETDLDSANMVLTPAETISVIGFPFGMSSYGRLPLWATGFLAQELCLIDKDNPVFLIDCRTRQGQSGSPVIAFRTSSYRTINDDGQEVAKLSGTKAWEFLGIYSGRVNPQSDLGVVWHVSALHELLQAAEDDYISRKKFENSSEKENV